MFILMGVFFGFGSAAASQPNVVHTRLEEYINTFMTNNTPPPRDLKSLAEISEVAGVLMFMVEQQRLTTLARAREEVGLSSADSSPEVSPGLSAQTAPLVESKNRTNLLSRDSFLDPTMAAKFCLLPPEISKQAEKAFQFFSQHFSQQEFNNIFCCLIPSLLTSLEGMDNTSWDSGCQDRASLLIEFLGQYENQIRALNTKKTEQLDSVPSWLRNFIVLNYLLGCCQERFGCGSFLNSPFPEERNNLRVDDSLRNCVAERTIAFLLAKKAASLAALTASLVSTLNKVRCMSDCQIRNLQWSSKFGIVIARTTHQVSFENLMDSWRARSQENNTSPPGFIQIVWTHACSDASGRVEASYQKKILPHANSKNPCGYAVNLFSLNLTPAQISAAEGQSDSPGGLFDLMTRWEKLTDGRDTSEGSDILRIHTQEGEVRVPLLRGKLNRNELLRLTTETPNASGVSVKHIQAIRANEMAAVQHGPSRVDLTQPFKMSSMFPGEQQT